MAAYDCKITFTGHNIVCDDGTEGRTHTCVIYLNGGNGSRDYNNLINKPKIGSVELKGTKTLQDLGAYIDDRKVHIADKEVSVIDTAITSPSDGQILKYSSWLGKWVNGEGGSGGNTTTFLNPALAKDAQNRINWNQVHTLGYTYYAQLSKADGTIVCADIVKGNNLVAVSWNSESDVPPNTFVLTVTVASVSGGGGVSVHNQLSGREAADSHPISAITGLQDFKNLFDSMFEKVALGTDWYIRAKKDFASIKGITSYAASPDISMKLSDISDVPGYVAGKVLKVKTDGSGLEWGEGGGGGGTTDYSLLTNKPKINSVELVGDKSLADLGIAAASHTHSQYALATDLANYLPLTGGSITGNLNISGNVGIGTGSPTEKLEVAGNIGTSGNIKINSSDAKIISSSDLNLCANNQAAGARLSLSNGYLRPWNADNEQISLGSPTARWSNVVSKKITLNDGSHSVVIELDASGNLKVNGNILATGGVTAYN